MVDLIGFNSKNKHKIVYSNIESSVRPMLHNDDEDDLKIPQFQSSECLNNNSQLNRMRRK